MELIIKVTEVCDFSCTFCSSSNISDDNRKILDIDYIKRFIKRFPDTKTIIVNGGEPLMLQPKYYWDIIDFLDEFSSEATISITSNLWNFYKNPKKWVGLFKHERVFVTTSFNYGHTRLIRPNIPYTETLFWEVSNLFLEYVGYRPSFIAVINEDNLHNAIDHVFLAKNMEVECKINYAMASGRQSKPLPLAKIYKIYIDIINMGMERYEYNSKQLLKRLSRGDTTCPQNRTCDEGIRAFNPDGGGEYYSCGSIADDRAGYKIDFEVEMNSTEVSKPLSSRPELLSLKDECLSCELFSICNGCYKTIKDMKEYDMVDEHCKIMKSLEYDITRLSDKT